MTDMNKIKGGTQDQRRIAQDRQRAREKKNAQSDPLSKSAPDVKAPPTPTKDSAKSDSLAKTQQKSLPPADKGGSLVKPTSDKRKSEMGKWSQGVKQSPDKLAKKTPNEKVDKVKVKDVTPKKQVNKTNSQYSSLKKPEENKATPQSDQKVSKRRKPLQFGKKLKNLGIGDKLKNASRSNVSVDAVSGDNLEGPEVGTK